MKIKWLGHACFLLSTNEGLRIITDPYQSGAFGNAIRHAPVDLAAEVVTVSHGHLDHGYLDNIKGDYKKIDQPGLYEIDTVVVEGFSTSHDQKGGSLRGKNIVFKFTADGVSVCHFGDIGHIPDDITIKKIGRVDAALIPVGGTFTVDNVQASKIIDLVNPKVTIPMHYRSDRCRLNIDGVDRFLHGKDNVERIDGSLYELFDGETRESKIVVLNAAL